MLKEDYKIYEGKMKKSIDSVAADFASVRAGRANASVLDRIMVDYYGSPTPIRLSFPQLTEERRKELVKQIHKYAENGKVAIRNIRRDAMEAFKKKEKASEITEDDLKQAEKDLQKLTDDSCKELDALLAKKEKELMAV